MRGFRNVAAALLLMLGGGCADGDAYLSDGPTATPVKLPTLRLDLGEGSSLKLVEVPSGAFMMGSPASEAYREADEGPRRRVTITRPFYLGVTEVTRAQFAAFVAATRYVTQAEAAGKAKTWNTEKRQWLETPGACWKQPGFAQTDDHPVVLVTWNDAAAFCTWLGKQTRRNVRLPTEAEWEYACRAGTRSAYCWGSGAEAGKGWLNGADETGRMEFGWTTPLKWADGAAFTSPVGKYRPNAFGLYDMHGNAWEWCGDRYDADYYAGGHNVDPAGATGVQTRVVRGGAWSCHPKYCRSAFRGRYLPDHLDDSFGFRVAVDAR